MRMDRVKAAMPPTLKRVRAIARRVLRQVVRDRRYLALTLVAPLVVVFLFDVLISALHWPKIIVARFVIPLAAFVIHFVSYVLTIIVLVKERTAGTLERMFVNGYQPGDLVLGYLLANTLLATAQSLLTLIELQLLFRLNLGLGDFLLIFVVWWLLAVLSLSLGVLVSTQARSEGQVFPLIPLVMVPSLFFSGILVSVDRLPSWGKLLSALSPLYYANEVLQAILDPGWDLKSSWASLVSLPLYAGFVLLLAATTLRRTE
jgi:ABC-2 type transport system permease protein